MGSTDQVTVGLDFDGYDVDVEIHATALERAIRRVEQNQAVEINENGFRNIDLSKFVTIRVDPTREKWDELADAAFRMDTDQTGGEQ